MDGLSVSVLLLNAGVRTKPLWMVQIFYALLVPIGALAFIATTGAVADNSTLVGCTLAFSAGTFLAIALTDLLPEIQFHAHDRHKLSAAMALGLLVMWVTSFIGHSSNHDHADPAGQELGHVDHSTHDH
jgi:zinc and cadmium transporter